jgi:hypothetical protein
MSGQWIDEVNLLAHDAQRCQIVAVVMVLQGLVGDEALNAVARIRAMIT